MQPRLAHPFGLALLLKVNEESLAGGRDQVVVVFVQDAPQKRLALGLARSRRCRPSVKLASACDGRWASNRRSSGSPAAGPCKSQTARACSQSWSMLNPAAAVGTVCSEDVSAECGFTTDSNCFCRRRAWWWTFCQRSRFSFCHCHVHYSQMDIVHDFVPLVSCPLILDHCGKPGIRQGAIAQYRDDMQRLARHKHLSIKLSDLPVTADHANWTEADLRPYIAATLDAFGPDRVIYAGDYPICLAATTLPRWVQVLDNAFADLGLSEAETRAIYRNNANRFYRLGL